MNIAYIIPKLTNKAPILVVKELVKQMKKNNHHCIVYYFDDGGTLDMECETKKIFFSKSIDFDNYDIIHSHGFRPDLYVSIHKYKSRKAKFVNTIHSYIIQDLSSTYNPLVGYIFGYLWILCMKRIDINITLSNNAKNYYSKWIDKNKIYYAYNTIDIDQNETLSDKEINEINNFKKNYKLIGINAFLSPIKGIDQIIKSLVYLDNYKLVIVGDGNIKDQLIDLANTIGVRNRVLFLGYKKNAYKYLPFYDIFAVPSRNEGFSLSLLEGAIFKRNVLCSDIPTFRELYSDEEVTFFEVDNIHSIVENIKNMEQNESKRITLNLKYINNYSPKAFYERYIYIYNSALSI